MILASCCLEQAVSDYSWLKATEQAADVEKVLNQSARCYELALSLVNQMPNYQQTKDAGKYKKSNDVTCSMNKLFFRPCPVLFTIIFSDTFTKIGLVKFVSIHGHVFPQTG